MVGIWRPSIFISVSSSGTLICMPFSTLPPSLIVIIWSGDHIFTSAYHLVASISSLCSSLYRIIWSTRHIMHTVNIIYVTKWKKVNTSICFVFSYNGCPFIRRISLWFLSFIIVVSLFSVLTNDFGHGSAGYFLYCRGCILSQDIQVRTLVHYVK